MDQQLEVLIKMRDQLSKPLSDQQKALRGVNTQIKDLIKTQKDAEKQAAKFRKEQQAASAALGEELVAAAGTAVAAVAALALGVTVLAAGLVAATVATVQFVSAQAAMNEKLATSSLLFTRDMEQAKGTRDMIDTLANRLRMGADKPQATAHELLAAGIKPQLELQRSVQAVSELQTTGNDDAANKLKEIFKKGAETRRQFGGRGFLGVSKADAMGVLGAEGWEQFQASLKARGGKSIRQGYGYLTTTVDQANAAFADAVTAGKIGAAAKDMVGGLPDVMEHLATTLRGVFKGVEGGPGFKAFMDSLHSAIDALEAFTKAGGASGGLSMLDRGFHLLSKGVDKALILTLHLVTWTFKFATAVIKVYGAIKKWLAQGDHMATFKTALMGVGLLLAVVLLTVVLLAAAFAVLWVVILAPVLIIIGLFALLGVAVSKMVEKFENWRDTLKDIKEGLKSTLTLGIAGTSPQEQAKIEGYKTGFSILEGVKIAMGINSPSREMRKLGAYSSQGFQQGIDSVSSFSMPGIAASSLSVGAGKVGGSGAITWTGDVLIQGGTNMGPDELKPLMTDAFADAMERLQLECSGG